MIYPESFEDKIKFIKIRQMLSDGCQSALGQEQVDAMQFSTHFEEIKTNLGQTWEFRRIQLEEDSFPDTQSRV